MKSRYVKNDWNKHKLKDRIVLFITQDLKLTFYESQNKEALEDIERELLRKGVY